jgi:hypothetical protein
MLNAQELINTVNEMVNEPTTGDGRWSDSFVLQTLNTAQDEVNLALPELLRVTDVSITTTAALATYTLPTAVGTVYQVLVNGSPIRSKSEDSLQYDALSEDIEESWMTRTGKAEFYNVENNVLRIYPIPTESSLVVTIIGELLLTQMTDSLSSYPFEGLPYLRKAQKIICLFAAADLKLSDGDNEQYIALRTEAKTALDELCKYSDKAKTADSHSIISERKEEGQGI